MQGSGRNPSPNSDHFRVAKSPHFNPSAQPHLLLFCTSVDRSQLLNLTCIATCRRLIATDATEPSMNSCWYLSATLFLHLPESSTLSRLHERVRLA